MPRLNGTDITSPSSTVGSRLIPDDEYFMRLALREAERAVGHGDIPVGAVVVHGGEVIAAGHNERELREDPTAHAEIVALREAARVLGSWRVLDSVLYVTLEPCAMCAGAIVLARVPRVVFGTTDPKAGRGGQRDGHPGPARAEPPAAGHLRGPGPGVRRPAAGIFRRAALIGPGERPALHLTLRLIFRGSSAAASASPFMRRAGNRTASRPVIPGTCTRSGPWPWRSSCWRSRSSAPERALRAPPGRRSPPRTGSPEHRLGQRQRRGGHRPQRQLPDQRDAPARLRGPGPARLRRPAAGHPGPDRGRSHA